MFLNPNTLNPSPEDTINLLFDTAISNMNRDGIEELADWARYETDFLTAPASTQYHLACPHGLAIHSLNVENNFVIKNQLLGYPLTNESAHFCGLWHDVNKIFKYKFVNGKYVSSNNVGHGKRSISLLSNFVDLTDAEEAIIRYHMGTFYAEECSEVAEYSITEMHEAIKQHKMVQVFASSDMECSIYEDAFYKPKR